VACLGSTSTVTRDSIEATTFSNFFAYRVVVDMLPETLLHQAKLHIEFTIIR
jgi:hypothetical protein